MCGENSREEGETGTARGGPEAGGRHGGSKMVSRRRVMANGRLWARGSEAVGRPRTDACLLRLLMVSEDDRWAKLDCRGPSGPEVSIGNIVYVPGVLFTSI